MNFDLKPAARAQLEKAIRHLDRGNLGGAIAAAKDAIGQLELEAEMSRVTTKLFRHALEAIGERSP